MRNSLFSRFVRWITSASGVTLSLTVAIAIIATIHKGPYILVNTFVTGGMWALMAVGVALLFGVMNISNFAHGEYFMIGSLTAYFIITPLTRYMETGANTFLELMAPVIAIFFATMIGALFGILTEKLIFYQLRKRNKEAWLLNCFCITLGLSVIFMNLHMMIFGTDFKGIVRFWDLPPLSIFDVYISVDRFAAFSLAMIMILIFWVLMKYSTMGKMIRAVSQDEEGARMVGISVNLVHTTTFALSCGLAALAGASLLFMFPSYPTVGIMPLYNSWFIIILVGFGNVAGAVPGGFIIALFQVLTRVYVGEGWENVIPMILISIILIVKPYGIFEAKVRSVWEQ